MVSFVQDYLQFVFRQPDDHYQTVGLNTIAHFPYKVAFWSIFFSLLYVVIPAAAYRFFPKWYNGLDERKRREFPAYVACLVHHFLMVPRAWIHVYQDYNRSDVDLLSVQYGILEAAIAPFSIGYLIGDTIGYAIPQMFRKDFEMIIHHIFTTWIVGSTIGAPGHFCRYIPHMVICDTTNIFFNVAWLLRAAGWRDSSFVTTLELLFAFSFVFVRAINLPLIFLAVQYAPSVEKLGWARFPMGPIALMQWYWLSIIIRTTTKRLLPKKSGKAQLDEPKVKNGNGNGKTLKKN